MEKEPEPERMVKVVRSHDDSIKLLSCLGLLRQPWWKIYEGLEYSSNQGSDNGAVILSRRIQRRDEPPDSLYVIQKEPYHLSDEVRTILKPMHDNIVTLYQVFHYEETLSFVYEEMDISLEQIFLLDVDPWSINPSQRDEQIASISQQVLTALWYVHEQLHISHGDVSIANILLSRTGTVKLANIGRSIMNAEPKTSDDCRAFAAIFVALSLPMEIKPSQDKLASTACDFHKALHNGNILDTLQVRDFIVFPRADFNMPVACVP
ncbi:uncharacterized protein MYCGRDRAFT_97575 [Zymoseptoria tritici IPO323]|uniref:EKC/KEOPS complex subunit BUD32 n=1 Tax=Zymoseptoria tritici (strain CBS 115943 / IPO323) TaxID=336722 RepID=F9XQN8_ZYMTI|nr:uncharacterized protein MYCGRDRAFT_97575 [Zymoseptoria tritici IPO323]EGP82390.1 hypothetical protein MYCGRDRAFT_97575 [Zymoseptoria tritici IPO323]